MTDDSWSLVTFIIILLVTGGIIGGAIVNVAIKTPHQPQPIIEVREGCVFRNATITTGVGPEAGTVIIVNQGQSNPLYRAPWPAFNLSQGTYPNGTQWQKLVVLC